MKVKNPVRFCERDFWRRRRDSPGLRPVCSLRERPIICPFLLRKKMDDRVLVSPVSLLYKREKTPRGKPLVSFGAEGETRQGFALSVRFANVPLYVPFCFAKRWTIEFSSLPLVYSVKEKRHQGENP